MYVTHCRNTELTVQNKSLTRENEKFRHQCEKTTQKVAEKKSTSGTFRDMKLQQKGEAKRGKNVKSRIFFERM